MKFPFFTVLILLPILAYGKFASTETKPYPYYDEDTTGETQMMPLHRAEESLQIRLEMIRKAQKSIDVEYFMYNKDIVGKIISQELIKSAQKGVKIRVLVDKLAAGLNSFMAHELSQSGIEVKFYNTDILLNLSKINYRNHRKLIVIDGEEAITGGRNLGDEYFNVDHKYNFEDRDVYVKGPIVKAMRDSFNAYYNHSISHLAKRRKRGEKEDDQKRWDKAAKAAKTFLAGTEEERLVRAHTEKVGNAQLEKNHLYPCPVATFVSDSPGATATARGKKSYRDKYRHVRKTFLDKMLTVDKEVTISTPYFIPNKRNAFIFNELLKKDVKLTVYTNSLRSTDSVIVSSNLYLHLASWLKKGMDVFFHDGNYSGLGHLPIETAKKSSWGTHAKTHIYEASDYSEVMIGSYNYDNRSDFYNTELAVYCRGNEDFTKNVKDDVINMFPKGLKAETLTHARDRNGKKVNITGASTFKQFKMRLLTLPSGIFKNLL